MEQLLGILLHTIGGFSSASFYVPVYKIRGWAWETYWILLGLVAWMLMPALGVWLVTTGFSDAWASTSDHDLFYIWLFGALWGFGGLFSGLGIRYMGLALGQSVSLGVSSVVGTLIPAVMNDKLYDLIQTFSGRIISVGLFMSVVGIICCGIAGHYKEKVLSAKVLHRPSGEFALSKGFAIAIAGGIMSACMAIAISFGEPLAAAAVAAGTADIFRNIPIFVVAFAGGFTTNLLYVIIQSFRNGSYRDFLMKPAKQQFRNYMLSVAAGVMWYLQFFFYGMGATKMENFEFASWSIHMSAIVIFSNGWGVVLKEWKGAGTASAAWLVAGIFLLIASILFIGWGNYA